MARVRPRTTGSFVREQSPVFALVLIQAFTFCVALQGDPDDLSKWKTFSSRAGWNMKYPRDWQVGSCNSCPDQADPNVFVSFYSPHSEELLMVEHLADKPQGQSVRQWLDDVTTKAILNPRITEEWITLAGEQGLKVTTRNAGSTQSEVVYVVHGVSTFQIMFARNGSSSPILREMLTTFRFTAPRATRPIHR